MSNFGTAVQWARARPVALVGVLLIAALPALVWALPERGDRRLSQVRTWTYQLQNLGPSLAGLRASPSDMLVIDHAVGTDSGMKPLSREQVGQLKQRPDGGRRLVIAYLSIGEAEEYRSYWRESWVDTPPDWLLSENCRWPKNHLVAFWHRGWREIVFDGAQSYLARIQAAGFDGVYLDRVDVYSDIAQRFPDARESMIAFVADLAAAARARNPGFLVIAQNAEELLDSPRYRRTIDAVAKEDLLYGLAGTGSRNHSATVGASKMLLDRLKAEGKPVFAVEYLTEPAKIDSAASELAGFGYRPVFPTRALDGANPMAKAESGASEQQKSSEPSGDNYGTPEYARRNCDGVWPKSTRHTQQ